MSRKNEISLDEWQQALLESQTILLDEIPLGWKTIEELGQIWNTTSRGVRTNMNALRKNGRVDSRKFRIMTGRGIYPVVHYKMKPK